MSASPSATSSSSFTSTDHSEDVALDARCNGEEGFSFTTDFDDEEEIEDQELTEEPEEPEDPEDDGELSVKSIKDLEKLLALESEEEEDSAATSAASASLHSIAPTPSLQSLSSSSTQCTASAVDLSITSDSFDYEIKCTTPQETTSPPPKVTIEADLDGESFDDDDSLYSEDVTEEEQVEDELSFEDVLEEELEEETILEQQEDGEPENPTEELLKDDEAVQVESVPLELTKVDNDDDDDDDQEYQDLVEDIEGSETEEDFEKEEDDFEQNEDDLEEDENLVDEEPIIAPNLISEWDYFHSNLAKEMREEDPDDYDFFETASLGDPEPFQTPKPSPYARGKSRLGSLLPAPPVSFSGPIGQFMQPTFSKAKPWDAETSRQWATFWQWAFYGAGLWSNYGRGLQDVSTARQAAPPQLWSPSPSGVPVPPGPRPNAAAATGLSTFEFPSDDGASVSVAPPSNGPAPRQSGPATFNGPNRNYDQYQLHHQPRGFHSNPNRGGQGGGQSFIQEGSRHYQDRASSCASTTGGYKPRFYHNQTQQGGGQAQHQQGGLLGRGGATCVPNQDRPMETHRASSYVRQWISNDTAAKQNASTMNLAMKKPPFLEQEVQPCGAAQPTGPAGPRGDSEKQSLSGGDGNEWYEFDYSSSDLRPSRGNGDGRGGRGGFNSRGAQRGGRGGGINGYQQRPQVAGFSKPFY